MEKTRYTDAERGELLSNVDKFREVFDKAINANLALRALIKSSGLYDKLKEYIPRVFVLLNSTEEGRNILQELGVYDFVEKIK